MKRKPILLSLVICLLIILIVCFCILPKEKINEKQDSLNNDDTLISNEEIYNDVYIPKEMPEAVRLDVEKEFNGLQISNIELQMIADRECELRATAYNPTDEIIEAQTIRIKVYDENGELDEIFGAQLSAVPAKESKELSALIRKDITKASDIELEVID